MVGRREEIIREIEELKDSAISEEEKRVRILKLAGELGIILLEKNRLETKTDL